MAVPEQTPYIEHIANGVTTSFALEFECKDKEHLIVLVDNVEPNVGTWSLENGVVVFGTAPANGKIISIQRNTPFRRDTNFQSYDNSLRPATINKDFDWIWYKLQELGVADWILGSRIDALKNYVDDRDDELRAYLMEEIRKQGVALDQLDDYYNYLMQRLAQIAVDKGWDSSFVVDASGLSQHEINNTKKYVPLVSDLKGISAKNGDIVGTNGHTQIGLGGGLYKFEALSSKVDNNGAWIASNKSAGTWVLISESFVEQWGVVSENTDQSAKIQACIDFNFNNGIHEYGFEKSNDYYISSPIVFKQRPISWGGAYSDPKFKTTFNFNGARLVAKTNNMTMIGVSRDLVRLNNPSFNADSGVSGVVAIYNGLLTENSDNTLRRSSMRMYLDNPSFDGVDVAMKFEPAETMFGGQWGAFYHTVVNPTAINTQIMYEFRQSKGSGDCSNTRNTFIGTKHVGGACTIYGEALESSVFLGVESEFINRADSRLPDGEAVGLYLPFGTPSDFQANKSNKFIGFNVEVCTNYVNINAPETHIDGFFQAATNPRSVAWKYTNVYGNLSYTEGGIVLRQYNGTPRFGMQQINDDGTSASLYLERGTGTGDYKISADGKIEIPSAILNNTYATNDVINFRSSNGTKNLQLNFNAELGMYLAGNDGVVGFTGVLSPALDNWSDIGKAGTNRVKNIYLVNAPVVSSDIKYKEDVREISDIEKLVASDLKNNIKSYRLISDKDKIHIGMIAQEVVSIFAKHGLDAHDYNMVELTQDNYSLRYEELIMFILSA